MHDVAAQDNTFVLTTCATHNMQKISETVKFSTSQIYASCT